MTEISVTISQGSDIWSLAPGENAVEVAESTALITVEAKERPRLYLDDDPLKAVEIPSNHAVVVAQIDLRNQVGFHRLRVRTGATDHTFDFATVSAKATWVEVQKMAEVCARHYLGYRRQFVYTSRSGERRKVFMPQVQFAWFRDRIHEVEALANDIARRPSRESDGRLITSVRSRGLSVPATIKLIHENPGLLEQRSDGPLTVDGERYWPAEVRVRSRDRIPAKVEHSQIGIFLRMLLRGIAELAPLLEVHERAALNGWGGRLTKLAGLTLFKPTPGTIGSTNTLPTAIQMKDSRYKRMRELNFEFQSDIAPHDTWRNAIRTNIKDVWDIYQTFVAHVVGNALSLDYFSSSKDLRTRDTGGASMAAAGTRLFFDLKPPKDVAESWRDASSRPADERPDILIHRSTDRARVMLDAKFRVDRDRRRAKPEDLFEMQGYLNSFAAHSGGIVFPGAEPRATYISGPKNGIAEIPLRAMFFDSLGGAEQVHQYVRAAVIPLWFARVPV